uniref:EamA-like transporter family protein n=1 Tax=mine drainage metagenome TaxID=410659 RepID=E6PV53_9ZZZZ
MDATTPPQAFVAVLAGAMLHACWNVAARRDRHLETALVVAGGAVLALSALPFLRQPAPAAWPHLLFSALLHVAYFGLPAAAYARAGVAVAPQLVLLAAVWWFAEPLTPVAWIGVMAICAGVLLMHSRWRPGEAEASIPALANAVVIAAYTLNGAAGARLCSALGAYALWIFPLTVLPTLAWLLRGRWASMAPRRLLESLRWTDLQRGLGGGASSLVSYALALWAMTIAPVAPVAALRETSDAVWRGAGPPGVARAPAGARLG